ncbi:P-loop containing nucleoside triphosphate hydrolases superfamily protein [Arabidopsis thaliana]|uniref:GTP-binding protein, putative n=1 Tax=Arabidopsis thaliana TaxID=3702 RepID=Q8L7Q9_ARATH|nr:P-loop containing nucleoside triphosphate hydrolases superfamily protein [Arabidopsis thaliana]AAM91521.1 GTP-binding protein, putative [Arabidopsis thaliana]AAN15349.1 GTP-binding protein, putative [Arabidopsis thaliana]AEE36446.1 P-loop containing nucleoside triphosphate hydrolases superfamily protein [Arabidopsis thaliana]|eukprot:NP_178192.1 P-loop containing nucleoside triphosphate hydrolases superfamily protein [Arabidopsis thaliana]
MKLASSLVPHQWRLLTSPQLSLQAFIFSTASTTKSHTFWSPSLRQCRNLQTALSPIVSSSYLPTSYITQKQIEIPTSPEKQSPPVQEGLGAFQKLPMVMPSIDLYASALRKSKRVQPTKGIANIAKRERNRGAKQLDAFMKELALPLKGYMESFPRKKLLHPYERSLIDLTLGDGKYEEVLGKVDVLRKKVQSVGKEHASLCAKALSKKEAEERLSEGVEKLELVFQQQGGAVDDLLTIAKVLRAMPVVDLEMPTLCLVGAPNVGKSSLVRILSTGKPEICNYPFTTRGILMGHIVLNYQRFQVTDTPGLLRRCDEDRNNLEKLTLAVLTHLPTAVLYVHDLTGECGTSPSDQFQIYKEMKERFKDYLWIDAVSKCDLLGGSPVMYAKEDRSSDDAEIIKYRERGPDESIHVSVKTEQGLNELKNKVKEVLSSEMEKIQSGEKTDQSVATC